MLNLRTARALICLWALLPLVLLPHAANASQSGGGWQKLWRNQNAAARADFRAALRQNPSDASALRGLAVLALQEGSEAAALQAVAACIHAAPGDWAAVALWPDLEQLAATTGRWSVLDAAARDILAARGAPPELRASARLALAESASRAGQAARAASEMARLGFVRKWSAIGPFENVSRSGFDEAYPPERQIALGGSYPGKDDQTLCWHRLGLVSAAGQCRVDAALGDAGASTFYAVTAIRSPREQPVVLRYDPTGASKVYANGQLVFSDDKVRAAALLVADPFRIPVTLRQGWNTLLVKLATDTRQQASFALRLTTPAGEDVPALAVDPSQARTPAPGAPASGAPAPAEPEAIALLRRQPASTETGVFIGRALRRAHDYQASAEALRQALAGAPECSWIRWELAQTLKDDDQADEARAEREAARKSNPSLVAAELAYLEDSQESFTPADMVRRMGTLASAWPGNGQVQWALSDAYGRAKMTSESLRAARAAARIQAGPEGVIRLVETLQGSDRAAEAEAAMAAGLRTTPASPTLLGERAGFLEEAGRIPAAIAAYERLLQVEPDYGYTRLALAALYQATKNLKRAAATLAAARSERPQNAAVCVQLADIYRAMGRKADAIPLYREAIRLDPSHVDVRDTLQIIAGDKPAMEVAPATPSQPILAAAAREKAPSGVSAVVLLDEARQVVYPDYATVARYHEIVRVVDQAGVKSYQSVSLGRGSHSGRATVESARLIKADGKIQDVLNSGQGGPDEEGNGTIAFPSLAPGDIIDYSYRVEDYRRGGLTRQFWNEWVFSSPDGPVKLSRCVLVTPPSMPLRITTHGAVPEPKTSDVRGWRVREWRQTDIPSAARSPLNVGPLDRLAWLDISTVGSWADVVNWYLALSGPRCRPDAAIRAKAAELTKGARTDDEKIRAIVAFVSRRIQYQSTPFRMSAYIPTEGKEVLRDRYGDCKDKAALLTAMLAAVGIKSEMVLLNLRSQGTTAFLPSPRFSHAIARVQTAAGPLWVDATAEHMEFGNLPFECQGVQALVIAGGTTDLSTTPVLPVEANGISQTYVATVDAGGKLNGSFELAARGSMGWALRSLFAAVPETARTTVLQRVTSGVVKDATYETGSIENQQEPDQPFTIRSKFHATGYCSAAGSFLLVRLPWSAERDLASTVGMPEKPEDLDVAASRNVTSLSVRMDLPAGYVPQDLQPEVKAESPWGSYRITYRTEGGTLHAAAEIRLTSVRVPAAEATRFADFFRAAGEELGRQIVLKRSAAGS